MKVASAILSVFVFLYGCSEGNREESNSTLTVADVVYMNGKIYTVNGTRPWVEAVAIKDGKFLAVGSNAEIEREAKFYSLTWKGGRTSGRRSHHGRGCPVWSIS